MSKQELLNRIRTMLERTAADKGLRMIQPINEETVLLDASTGLDSLDLAAIVVELSKASGKDPFRSGFIEFRTVGELGDLYADKNSE
jgi:acyl carrier protein